MGDVCPLCDSTSLFLSTHIWFFHLNSPVCWCGEDMTDHNKLSDWESADKFKQHCDANGGYLAHFLENLVGPVDA